MRFKNELSSRSPGFSPAECIGAGHNLTDPVFHAVGHDVYAADALDFADLLDQIDAEIHAFLLLVLGAL